MNVIKFNTDHIYFAGDLHGNFNSIGYHIKQYDIRNSLIIFCGDIGIGFNSYEYYVQTFKHLKKILFHNNVSLIFVRGNHDDKSYFDKKIFNYKRIKTVTDYSVIQVYRSEDEGRFLEPFNILCVGGAISIDRTDRLEVYEQRINKYLPYMSLEKAKSKVHNVYWTDEPPCYNSSEFDNIKNKNININAVVSHTSPSFCQPFTKDKISYWLLRDKNLEKDVSDERHTMDKIYERLKKDGYTIDIWCYGHFHFHHYDLIENTKFYLLDKERNGIIDMVEYRNF